MVRDRTAAVALGYRTGFFLYGAGGGKSYTVLNALDQLEMAYQAANSRMTGRGRYNALETHPDGLHVLEYVEAITKDRAAQGVLRSACWGQTLDNDNVGQTARLVTWTTHGQPHSFLLTGGLIVTSNRPLGILPELQAVGTRIATMHWEASRAELVALMRSIAPKAPPRDGRTIDPQECSEICEYFFIEQSRTSPRPLNMRLLDNGFQDYLQWREGDAGCHWEDLISSRLNYRATAFKQSVILGGHAEREAFYTEAARQVAAAPEDCKARFELWISSTGKSEPRMCARLARLRETAAVA